MSTRGRGATRTTAAAVVVAAVLAVLLAVPVGAAGADPRTPSAAQVAAAKAATASVAHRVGVMQAQLAVAQARMQALGEAVDAAGEAYNGALYKLQRAQQAAVAANGAAAGAQAEVEAAQLDVGRLANAAYRGDSMSLSLAALTMADSPGDAIEQVSTLAVLAGRQAAVLDRLKAARLVAGILDKQASDALVAVSQATAAAQRAKLAVQAKVATQQSQVAVLGAEVSRLSQALATVRAHSRSLTNARNAALERAAEARRRAAEQAKRDASRHSSGGVRHSGGGTDTASHPGTIHATRAGAARAIAFAKRQLGKPYEWAATGPDTWDCSGLTMMAWRAGGVFLPHWSVAQWEVSTPVSRSDARPGDLVFYAYNLADFTSIHHVALYLGGGLILEAPFTGADVRISSVDRPDLFGFARP